MPEGFVMRYDASASADVDGLGGREGAFLACSFWMADDLHLIGRSDEAAELFDRLVSLSNDLGLLAEEYDPVAKRQVGNFPQAFSHVSLVNTAVGLGNHGTGLSHADRLKGVSVKSHRLFRRTSPETRHRLGYRK
jgi:GH15 family glucan-1,4-alpha-glucosidase